MMDSSQKRYVKQKIGIRRDWSMKRWGEDHFRLFRRAEVAKTFGIREWLKAIEILELGPGR